jgi:tetratricopeptide (TPR) repeat protein
MILTLQGGNIDSSSTIQLLQIAQQQKNDSMLAIAYNWIGSYFSSTKGDNISALEYYFKGIPVAEKTKDKRRLSSLYFDIAIAYYALQNFEEGFKYNMRGGENLPDKSSPIYEFMLVQYQRNAVTFYLQKHQADSALHYGLLVTEQPAVLKLTFLFTIHFF